MLHWFAKRREGDVKIIGGVGGGVSVGSLLWISDVYLGSFTILVLNITVTFSKVETGTGTITFQK